MIAAWSDSETNDSESDEEHTINTCLMANEEQDDEQSGYESNDEVCLKSRQNLWYLDSGCSRHMSGNASLFTKIKKKGHGSVTFGDKSMGKIIGVGKIGKDPSNSIDMFI